MRSSTSVALYAAAVLAGLAGAWSLWMFAMVYREDRTVSPAGPEAFLKAASEVRQALRGWS